MLLRLGLVVKWLPPCPGFFMAPLLRTLRNAALMITAIAACTTSTTEPPPVTLAVQVSPGSLAIQAGGTGQATVTVSASGPNTGAITVSLASTPSGVSASFSPLSGPGNTTLSLSVESTVAPGSYPLTIQARGERSSNTATTSLTLVVGPPPSFSLTLASSAINVTQGQSGTATVNVARAGGFAGSVALALEGAPAGVTGAFNPNPASSTSSALSVTVGSAVPAGTYSLTIRGTASGLATQTATLSLTVLPAQAPGFTLGLGSGLLTVTQGQGGTNAISITRTGGFTGNVNLALEGTPSGVTGTFNPNPASGTSSILTVNVGAAVAPGSYTLTVRGSTPSGAPGIGGSAPQLAADQTASFSLTVTVAGGYTLAATNTNVEQGGTGTSTITLTRTGGNTSNVTLALEGAPTGVTGSFAPAVTNGASSTLTLTVAPTAAVGTSTLTVRGTADGLAAQTTTFTLTVTAPGNFSLAASPSSFTVQAGSAAVTSTIAVTRTNGFAGSVAFTHTTTAPAGVTIAFVPTSTTGASVAMNITVGSGVAAGTYTITVKGNATGLAEQTATVSLTVTAPPGGGGNITWTYCPGVGVVPTWLAVQDGSGAWTRVTPTVSGALRTYTFSVATRGGVAWVEVDETDGSADLSIMYGTTTELTNAGFACDGTGAVKTVNGTVAGVGLLASAFINLGGGGTAVNNPGTSWSIPNVSEGSVDLLATRSVIDPLNFAAGQVTDALVIRRNLNPAAGSTLPVINFDGAEKLTPERPTLTVTNPSGSMIALSSFETANGEFGNLGFSQLGAAPYTYTAVPASGRMAGDLHWLTLFSESGIPGASSGEYRSVTRIFSGAGAQSMTFGSSPPAVTYSNGITAPYLRPRAQFTNTAEYADLVFLGWADGGGRQNSVNVTIWEGYLTSLAVDYTLPDFSGVAGWSNLWGLENTDMQTQMSVTGWTSGGGPGQQPTVAGSVFYTAGRYTNPEVALRSLLRGPRPRR